MLGVTWFGYRLMSKSLCGEMNELLGAASLPIEVSDRSFTTVCTLSESFSIVIRSPPPSTGFSPPAVAGGKPKTPTLASRLLVAFFGKKPVMNEPCMYIQHFGGLANIGLPAVPKLVLAMALWPPRVLPVGEQQLAELVGGLLDLRRVEHDLVRAPIGCTRRRRCCFMISVSNQSVAGQPVAVSDSMPMHHGVLPSDLIWSVSCSSAGMVVGRLVAGACPTPSSGTRPGP